MNTLDSRPPSLLAFPSYLAGNVSIYGRRAIEAELAAHGLKLEHHAVITALNDFGPQSQQEISRRLRFDKSHLVRHIDFLEERGIVTRSPDPHDRRRHRVELTDDGVKLIAALAPAARRSQREFLGCLSAAEQRTLVSLLRRVLEANDADRCARDNPGA
ncbi:MAG TPA: MarR family transcriptional regulator [Stackebrandtia sp.]|jgi:DNA-binding MarR family transcriptional regulator|uniref:MarR family winged helix-turn-helix transcriptional regulator n=1 Tax=Stackebrandtia sp. TaxID=2023065 RepID=UPI002D46E091|nr:MarR family transcriptional regulator [Stackebrandtia sp.]HZE40083.1 MarR family transcriptional regulator [Stackebrandtia sp.]